MYRFFSITKQGCKVAMLANRGNSGIRWLALGSWLQNYSSELRNIYMIKIISLSMYGECWHSDTFIYIQNLNVKWFKNVNCVLSGPSLPGWWRVCGGSSPWSWSAPIRPTWPPSSLWSGWSRPSSRPRTSPSRPRSSMAASSRDPREPSLGWANRSPIPWVGVHVSLL